MNYLIQHLCVGHIVAESIGFTDEEHIHKYVYLLYGNYGDLYCVRGGSYPNPIGKIIFNPDKLSECQIEIYQDYVVYSEVGEVAKLLKEYFVNHFVANNEH